MVSVDDIEQAAARVAGRVRVTPVVMVEPAALGVVRGRSVALKLELVQHTGSFKPRGAFNRILAAGPIGAAGVIAASGGNHGMAVAHAAGVLGLHAEVFVPRTASPVKIARIRALGAHTTLVGDSYGEAYDASVEQADATGAVVVHAYDQPEVVAGQGTLGRELDRQIDGAVDTVLVAVGGGGLASGIGTWFDGRARIVAVEPERAPTLAHALAAGRPVDVEAGGVAADSLGARRIGRGALQLAQRQGWGSLLVGDDAILAARRQLWAELRLATEAGGATALAALTSGRYRPGPAERVAVILCGANTDPADLTGPHP